mgnify:CR=1 FL=1
MATPLETRAEILGHIWVHKKNDPGFAEFVEYNDLGLPLSYLVSAGIVDLTPRAEVFINESWDVLMGAMEYSDIGFDTFDEVFDGGELFPNMMLLEEDWEDD